MKVATSSITSCWPDFLMFTWHNQRAGKTHAADSIVVKIVSSCCLFPGLSKCMRLWRLARMSTIEHLSIIVRLSQWFIIVTVVCNCHSPYNCHSLLLLSQSLLFSGVCALVDCQWKIFNLCTTDKCHLLTMFNKHSAVIFPYVIFPSGVLHLFISLIWLVLATNLYKCVMLRVHIYIQVHTPVRKSSNLFVYRECKRNWMPRNGVQIPIFQSDHLERKRLSMWRRHRTPAKTLSMLSVVVCLVIATHFFLPDPYVHDLRHRKDNTTGSRSCSRHPTIIILDTGEPFEAHFSRKYSTEGC